MFLTPHRRQPRAASLTRGIAFSVLGAITYDYFFDERLGRRRRVILRDQLAATGRQFVRLLMRRVRYSRGEARGVLEETFHLHAHDNPEPDDRTLKTRLESELFRDPRIPKGQINIDVVEGVVELRGQLDSLEHIREVESSVHKIAGVWIVRSYLHVPGTAAPNKARVLSIA